VGKPSQIVATIFCKDDLTFPSRLPGLRAQGLRINVEPATIWTGLTSVLELKANLSDVPPRLPIGFMIGQMNGIVSFADIE
jgi:hypothetical protein